MTHTNPPLRPIRSFVRREAKGTLARTEILKAYWPAYGLSMGESETLDPQRVFGRVAPLVLEIGFGRGETLLQMALESPEKDFIGVEVYHTGLSQLLVQIDRAGLKNLRLFAADATLVLKECIADASLSTLQIFFPDPWPKRKHHKRRLIQAEFIKLLASKLAPEGCLHIATDWADYAEQSMRLLSANPHFENEAGVGCYAQRPPSRPFSKYERRGLALGHSTWDLIFKLSYNELLGDGS